MIRLSALLALPLLATACAEPGDRAAGGGACPAGETCSDDTPYGLYFLGTPRFGVLDGGPATTAIGGTQEITIERESGAIGNYVPFTLPYVADDDGGLGVKVVSQTGAAVSVKGVATRSNYLRILSNSTGELYDRKMIDAAAIDSVALSGPVFGGNPHGDDIVFFIGEQKVGIALLGLVQGSSGPEAEHLVDTSMTITATGSDRTAWDTLHFADAHAGILNVHVEAAAAAHDLPLEFVDHADAIAFDDSDDSGATVPVGKTGFACFRATNAGRFIYGIPWAYTVDGVTSTATFGDSCVSVDGAGHQVGDTIHVTATAGGKSSSLDVHVVADPNARTKPARHRQWRTVEGERALALTE